MAVGIGISPSGSWADVDRSTWSCFYSDAIQDYILDLFSIDGVEVDPYDGADFSGPQLDTLVTQLTASADTIQGYSPDWPFTSSTQIDAYTRACSASGITPLAPRDQALRTIRETIALAQKARSLNHVLVFCGD
jgi:hypothetical protein